MIREGDEEGIKDFDAKLWFPPNDAPKEAVAELPEWAPEAQASDFMAAMAAAAARGSG